MPTDAEILSAMKNKGHKEIPQGGSGSAVLLQVLQQNKGQWFGASDFNEALKEAGIVDKYVSNKLTNLGKKNEAVEVKKEGGRNFYRVA